MKQLLELITLSFVLVTLSTQAYPYSLLNFFENGDSTISVNRGSCVPQCMGPQRSSYQCEEICDRE